MSHISQSERDPSVSQERSPVLSTSPFNTTRESISDPVSSSDEQAHEKREQVERPEIQSKKEDVGQTTSDNPPPVPTISQAERDALAALTGETVTDETLSATPEVPEGRVSAFNEPPKQLEDKSEKSKADDGDEGCYQDDDDRSSISEPLGSLRTQVKEVFEKSKAAIRKSVSVISTSYRSPGREWVKAEEGILDTLNSEDADVLREVLQVAKENYDSDRIYFRKVSMEVYGQFVEWQVKFRHRTRGCREHAGTLKDAVIKVKSHLDYKEPGELDDRFAALYERIRGDKRFSGTLILFKEGKSKDIYPWKVRVHHETRGFNKAADNLATAILVMEEHLEYEEATPEEHKEVIWQQIFKGVYSALDDYPKCKVFYKEGTQDGTDGEPENVWYMKVDHPNRGIQFEAQSRIFEEAAGQIYDYLKGKRELTNTKGYFSTWDHLTGSYDEMQWDQS